MSAHSRGRPSRSTAGGGVTEAYWHNLDLFLALTGAATATSRLRLAAGLCLLTERDPIIVAKETATLDHLCGGRLIFGVGAGWNKEELANHGTDFHTRWELLRERTAAVRTIWTHEQPECHGNFVDFGPDSFAPEADPTTAPTHRRWRERTQGDRALS